LSDKDEGYIAAVPDRSLNETTGVKWLSLARK